MTHAVVRKYRNGCRMSSSCSRNRIAAVAASDAAENFWRVSGLNSQQRVDRRNERKASVVSRKQTKPPKPSVAAAAPPKAQRKPRSKLAGVERHRVLSGEVKGPSVRLRVAKNVARIRAELKLSLAEMGERTGIDCGFISAIERGDQNLTLDTLSNLAVAYGVPARRPSPRSRHLYGFSRDPKSGHAGVDHAGDRRTGASSAGGKRGRSARTIGPRVRRERDLRGVVRHRAAP